METQKLLSWKAMELSKKTKRGKSSKVDKIPNVGKGRDNLDIFTKQM